MENSRRSLACRDECATAPQAASALGMSSTLLSSPPRASPLADPPPLPPSPAYAELVAARAALSLSKVRVDDLRSRLEEARAALVEKAASSTVPSSAGSEGGAAGAQIPLPLKGPIRELASAQATVAAAEALVARLSQERRSGIPDSPYFLVCAGRVTQYDVHVN